MHSTSDTVHVYMFMYMCRHLARQLQLPASRSTCQQLLHVPRTLASSTTLSRSTVLFFVKSYWFTTPLPLYVERTYRMVRAVVVRIALLLSIPLWSRFVLWYCYRIVCTICQRSLFLYSWPWVDLKFTYRSAVDQSFVVTYAYNIHAVRTHSTDRTVSYSSRTHLIYDTYAFIILCL